MTFDLCVISAVLFRGWWGVLPFFWECVLVLDDAHGCVLYARSFDCPRVKKPPMTTG